MSAAPLDRSDYLLDPSVTFLNHGSFGACPRVVFDAYQNWQRELEHQPVLMLGRRIDGLLRQAAGRLAEFVGAPADDLVFVQNATAGVNLVVRSLCLQPGDEIIVTDHEYGACRYAVEAACAIGGARIVEAEIPLPLTDAIDFADAIMAHVGERTQLILVSHVTSATALVFPVDELLRRARLAGVPVLVDGAHAPGYLVLDVLALAPDFYTGNCHKWMCSPKGSGFLYARPEHQPILTPLPVSWGYPASRFTARVEPQGTRDPSAHLSVPDAIRYVTDHDWQAVQSYGRALALGFAHAAVDHLGCARFAGDAFHGQMAAIALPPCDVQVLKTALYERWQIEVPVYLWKDQPVLRISVAGYNTPAEVDQLIDALSEELPHRVHA